MLGDLIIPEIVVPGQPVSKKNSKGQSYWRKLKNGRKVLRDKPVTYYSPAYREYIKYAVQALAVWKTNQDRKMVDDLLPIYFKVNVQFLFFYWPCFSGVWHPWH